MFPILQAADIDAKLGMLLARRTSTAHFDLEAAVNGAYAAVNESGEAAIVDYSRQFDAPNFSDDGVHLTDEFIAGCVAGLSPELHAAIKVAITNISAVNARIVSSLDNWTTELAPGHVVGERSAPFASAMLWVPARKAPLLSTAIMLCAAATTAGVGKIILATPPQANGLPDSNTVAAGYLAGARHFVCGNGLATIAAAASGNWRHGRVNAIYGPGPQAITLAMLEAQKYGVARQPGIGPSDSLIIFEGADDPTHYRRLARNFLTELEHGPDSFTYALTCDPQAARRLQGALDDTMGQQFGREAHYQAMAEKGHGAILLMSDRDKLLGFVNGFAPEHLLIDVSEASRQYYLDHVVSSEILDGAHTPLAAANYCIGVTAVLPTNGFACSFSGVNARNFVRFSSYARLDAAALARLQPAVEAIGSAEGLPNHLKAVREACQ